MAFNFGQPKTISDFTLPVSTAPATGGLQFNLSGASGDSAAQPKPLALFGPAPIPTSAPAPTTSASTNLGTAIPAPQTLNFGLGPQASASLSVLPTTSSSTFAFGSATTATSVPSGPLFSSGGLTVTTAASASALPSTGTLTFAQLEDAINKWTVDLEEQGKVFNNQAKHLNAWDRLLMTNGEKIMNVSSGMERIKQQQAQLDQELDFVLAQQKELEDCLVPLEKEYRDVPVSDADRDQTYKMAENIDAQLRQMSEDLKEVIEQLNESNKVQELSDPVVQIGRILNAHMNSLQWIDQNTSQISGHLDEIGKMHDLSAKAQDNLHGA